MTWNWQTDEWPHFKYKPLSNIDNTRFSLQAGQLLGLYHAISPDDQMSLIINLISDESVETSEIEGEHLSRHSVQSSIRRHFGLQADHRNVTLAEQGIADMMVDLYRAWQTPLTHHTLYRWHSMLMQGHPGLPDVGRYRTDSEPMQVISGPLQKQIVHFEAPPSDHMMTEMTRFISWFNETGPDGANRLPPVIRAGLAHLYFVSIHPFSDGNGRIARALAQKALAQNAGHPLLIVLSQAIQADKKSYYAALERNNKTMDVTDWLDYFSRTITDAQVRTQGLIHFIVFKTRLYERVKDQLNDRQHKILARLFQAGPAGFAGGLSAANYRRIIGPIPPATITRDLQDMVEKNILTRTGERKATRYELAVQSLSDIIF